MRGAEAPPSTGKVLSLPELASAVQRLKARGRRVVHCHGVFDLLHIGHIRHFEEARAFGDALVVTLTPDRFVNKGPGRPVFPQDLRAEAVAALSCVDLVAINRWPMAVPAIKALKPDFYVKGPDYGDPSKDVTGGIALEKKAAASVGGQFRVTRAAAFSSSNIINRTMSGLPLETVEYLSSFSRRHPAESVLGFLKKAAALKILLVGEAIIDEYRYCRAIGKSSKEPMLAVLHKSTERFVGGILAPANHLSGFCRETAVASYLGELQSEEAFVRSRLRPGVKPFFVRKAASPTIVKRRIIDDYFFTKLLSVYEMNDAPMSGSDNRRFCDFLRRRAGDFDLVVVVDFGHGLMTPEAIRILGDRARFLAVNTQSNAGNQGYHTISQYPRADYICMADNEFRLEARDRHRDLREIVLEVSRRFRCPRIVVTGGKAGCLAYGRGEGFFEVPAVATSVVDRMGAGDAFLALSAPCAALKAPIEVSAFVGNAAGAQAVATVGHRAWIERTPFFKHVETLLK